MRHDGVVGTSLRKAVVAGAMLVPLAATAALPAAAEEIIVTVEHVKALDKVDLPTAGQADFYAQVTIDGKTIKSKFIRRADDIRPDWVMVVPVGRGRFPVKLEILDHNVLTKPTLVDINRLPNKRDLDFEVNTRNCTISGFAQQYKCRQVITRGGDEKRKAEVQFTVDVRR
ncbi:MAG: hypothetical protein SFW09_12000 [Hyphomicrobiaceae bacterium]|nr:hypothetical protein [Hyphomicrobiaceae bacterium]